MPTIELQTSQSLGRVWLQQLATGVLERTDSKLLAYLEASSAPSSATTSHAGSIKQRHQSITEAAVQLEATSARTCVPSAIAGSPEAASANAAGTAAQQHDISTAVLATQAKLNSSRHMLSDAPTACTSHTVSGSSELHSAGELPITAFPLASSRQLSSNLSTAPAAALGSRKLDSRCSSLASKDQVSSTGTLAAAACVVSQWPQAPASRSSTPPSADPMAITQAMPSTRNTCAADVTAAPAPAPLVASASHTLAQARQPSVARAATGRPPSSDPSALPATPTAQATSSFRNSSASTTRIAAAAAAAQRSPSSDAQPFAAAGSRPASSTFTTADTPSSTSHARTSAAAVSRPASGTCPVATASPSPTSTTCSRLPTSKPLFAAHSILLNAGALPTAFSAQPPNTPSQSHTSATPATSAKEACPFKEPTSAPAGDCTTSSSKACSAVQPASRPPSRTSSAASQRRGAPLQKRDSIVSGLLTLPTAPELTVPSPRPSPRASPQGPETPRRMCPSTSMQRHGMPVGPPVHAERRTSISGIIVAPVRMSDAGVRPPPAGLRGALSWGVGPNAYEVDGRPGTRGCGRRASLDGRQFGRSRSLSQGSNPSNIPSPTTATIVATLMNDKTSAPSTLSASANAQGLFTAGQGKRSLVLSGSNRLVACDPLEVQSSTAEGRTTGRVTVATVVEDEIEQLLECVSDEELEEVAFISMHNFLNSMSTMQLPPSGSQR